MAGITSKSFSSLDETRTPTSGACVIEPGHDGWAVGDTHLVVPEFESGEVFAKA